MSERFLNLLERLFLEIDQDSVLNEVAELRSRRPSATPEELADELTRRAARKAAVTGTAAGAAGGPIGMLAMAPDIFNLVRLQSRLILSIAFVYGREPHLKQRFREVIATLAVSTGAAAARRAARYLITRGIEAQLAKAIVRKIAGRAVARKLPSVVPVIGGAAGAVLNYAAVRATGKAAVAFYANDEQREDTPEIDERKEPPQLSAADVPDQADES